MKTFQEQLACAKRELALRRNTYPKWVETNRMKQEKMDHEIECMDEICKTIERRIELEEISGQMKMDFKKTTL